jgi:hypothetical protein
MSEWPEELDAVAAAPRHHRVMLENESVRVLETIIEPGEIVPLHTHRWPATMYLVSWSDFVRRDELGNVTLDTRELESHPLVGEASWLPPLGPHTLENVGEGTIHAITVEVKTAAV